MVYQETAACKYQLRMFVKNYFKVFTTSVATPSENYQEQPSLFDYGSEAKERCPLPNAPLIGDCGVCGDIQTHFC